jgi:predicted metal-dependent hydrolase
MWSNARSERLLEAQLPVPLDIVPVRSARRLRLRFDEARGSLKLTCPPRISRRAALAWVLDQRDWIDRQVAAALPAEPFVPGAIIPVEGMPTRLVWAEAAPRAPVRVGDEICCGGPQRGFARRVEQYLKAAALDTLSRDVAEYCGAAGVSARAVAIGDPAGRWGSCTSEGRIRFSWRLILAAPAVRRYVVAHEVAHLVHLNHGPAFKALEARLFGPGVAEAKSALRREGPRLRRVGRGH